MKDTQTPLMRQYHQIKSKYPETVLLFRMGDFFETFFDDALICSKVCGIILTKRNNGSAGDMPLAGFPHHQLENYLPKLVRGGYRVAVCEQLEDPKLARGIVRRDVIEVVTPGVAMYDKLLDTKKNNYVCALVFHSNKVKEELLGLSFADISTGEYQICETEISKAADILESLAPSEIIISKAQKELMNDIIKELSFKPAVTKLEDWIFEENFGRENLIRHFKTKGLKGFGIEYFTAGIIAAGAVLHYISETQSTYLAHLNKIRIYDPSDYMQLDYATRRNLEITFSNNDSGRDGSLISILDKTLTAAGSRMFKKWLVRPLRNIRSIRNRLLAVRALYNNDNERQRLQVIMGDISDLERIISKVCTGRANPRDIVALKNSLALIPEIKSLLILMSCTQLNAIADKLDDLKEIVQLITNAIIDEPSITFGSANIFRQNYSAELDSYIDAKFSAKNWLDSYQELQRRSSGISNLRVGFTSVFGYYIEISRANSVKAPENFQRKQTLANAERYTTPELKEFEEKILAAEEKISSLESELFGLLRSKIAEFTSQVQENAQLLATLDCLQSFAQVSIDYQYTEPKIDESESLDIIDGRHPVVERLLGQGESYTSNSIHLDLTDEQIHIITGPNMAGKSCYLRQTALIVLLGQIGCFVPAYSAKFGMIDRIFTRVGAQDNISAGESTFLIEMQELANIINNATQKSLILLDELGRGTATFDGISIAWAISEYIHNVIRAKTIFATHYHELNELALRYERIKNYRVEVIETGETIIFSHKVAAGGSDHSFGIHVAQLAGLPVDVIDRANEIMHSLESGTDTSTTPKADTSAIKVIKSKGLPEQLAIFEIRDDELRDKLREVDVNNITPVQALQILSDLHKETFRAKKK
ncbi:MAG: DNA mismatch repair protein MutS [Candidatus Kapabacteria bacterium]|nr:DNA mismatch repair protein MutS [Candidatus Kapabacteria bacterium]